MPGTAWHGSRCTAQPHIVGPRDWALTAAAIALLAVIGISMLRRRDCLRAAQEVAPPQLAMH